MDIEVEYIDQNRNLSNRTESINGFGLIKHLAIAGQGYLPSVKYYTRTVGLFLHYIEYLKFQDISASHFSEPPPVRRDPTEKGDFSTLAGKGIADFLAKKLSGAKVTHNYESAMTIAGFKVTGKRPDLYCIGTDFQFGLEAKGYSIGSISGNEMLKHKDQAISGPLLVHFSVASVSYNMYEKVYCKYHDPFNRNVRFNEAVNQELNRVYYSGIFEYLDFNVFRIEEDLIQNRRCFFIDIIGPGTPYSLYFGQSNLALILQHEFKKFTTKDFVKFNDDVIQGAEFYLDTDGIGIGLRMFKSPPKQVTTEAGGTQGRN
jgi:hypothetical protein